MPGQLVRNGAPAIPDYWKQYRENHPAAVERNRQQQTFRDQKRRLRNLANNNSALDLKHSAAQVWLLGPGAAHLANNNSAPAQVWVSGSTSASPRPAVGILQTTTLWIRPPILPDKENRTMLTTEQINDLHRLYWSEHWPIRKIERHLHMGWRTIRKYLDAPAQGTGAPRPRRANSIPSKPPSPNGWKRMPP